MSVLRVQEIIKQTEQWWPSELAEDWDAIGLVCGESQAEVSALQLCVDLTHEVIDEAIENNAHMIIAHHPLFLKGTTTVASTTYKGSLIHRLIKCDIAFLVAHTNADAAEHGVSAALAQACMLQQSMPLVPDPTNPKLGLGRVGTLATAIPVKELAMNLSQILPLTVGGIRIAGDVNKLVTTVAVCAGAGDSFFDKIQACKAEVYITSDLRHHPALEAIQNSDLALIDTSHFASESLWLSVVKEQFYSIGLPAYISRSSSDPWTALVMKADD